MGPESVTVWQVEFISTHAPTEVEILSILDGFSSLEGFLLYPTLPQLALEDMERVCIWSIQDSKYLLDSASSLNGWMSFSPDGHFFVCLGQDEGCNTTEIHLWKESHASYVSSFLSFGNNFGLNLYFLNFFNFIFFQDWSQPPMFSMLT